MTATTDRHAGPTEHDVEHHKELVCRLTRQGFNDGDLSGVEQHFTEDYRAHAPGVPPLPPGPGAFLRAVTLFRTAMPDIHVTVEDVIGEGDRVFARFTTRGTHTGPLMGIPPTGRPVTVHEWVCHRFHGNRVAESWIGDNIPRILVDIGALTAQAGPAAAIVGAS